MANIEMAIDSIRVSTMNYQRVVILKVKDAERYLPIWIGPAEADAIAVKLQNIAVPKPLTHDLLCEVIKWFGGKVSMAIIDKLRKDTFEAKLVLATTDKSIEVECRPSDALAIAVRVKAPIFAEKSVLDKAGVLFDEAEKPYEQEAVAGEVSEEYSQKLQMFSPQARQVLSLSEEQAKQLGHHYVETKHLLFALGRQSDSVAAMVLTRLGVEIGKLQSAVGSLVVENGEGGLSVNVKGAINLAVDELRRLNDRFVDTEHLLLGLVREGKGGAAEVLENSGVTPEKIYAELLRLCKRGFYDSGERG